MADVKSEEVVNTFGKTFRDLKLNDWIISQCETFGLTTPTPVQFNCIPPILAGKDCIGCAQTGSGKTLAFALPILQKLCEDPYGIFALILTPTRELAMQIAEQFRVLGRPISIKDCLIVGGMDMVNQGQELSQNPHIVIATPGRLADHIESCNTFTLKRIKYLVLDEADRLLEGNFNEQLETIFGALPKKRQTLLFSATITETLEDVKSITMSDPFYWSAGNGEISTVDQLDQRYLLCPAQVRDSNTVHLVNQFIEKNPKGSLIIFTNTCRSCQILCTALRSLGFNSVALHSMASQRERVSALSKFKSNQTRILIATDVASRGLDIPQVELVINHFIPNVAKDYIHRVGRTARAGRGGMAVTLVTQYDINLLHSIEDLIKIKLTEHKIKEKEMTDILTQVSVAVREADIRMDENDFGEKRRINKRKKMMIAGLDPDEEERKINNKQKEKKKRNFEEKREIYLAKHGIEKIERKYDNEIIETKPKKKKKKIIK